MRNATLFAALAAASLAQADPVRTDPSSEVTIYTDAGGASVVTLVRNPPSLAIRQPLNEAMNEKQNGKTHMRNKGNSVFGLGKKSYWVRIRTVDGRLVCEKFAPRPDDPAQVDEFAKALLAASCD